MVTIRAFFLTALTMLVAFFVWSYASAAGTFSLLPNGEGSNLQFTPSAGTTHYTLVDETPCNGATDYNRATTVGHRDSYTVSLASVPDGATVTDIAIKPCASRNTGGGGSSTMNVFYRFNGATSSDSGAYALSGTTPVELATTTFSSLALDKVSTSTAEIGAVYTAGTRGVRLSRISTIVTYNPLNAPTGLSGSSTTTSAAFLSWTDNSLNEDGFEVERSPDGSSWAVIATLGANVASYNNTGLSASTTYHYRVRTFNAGVYSVYSSTVVVTTKAAPPNAPSGLTANASTTALRISLSWTDNSSDETSFKIERQIGAGAFSLLTTTAVNAVSYDDNTVSAGTAYGYRVSAFSTAGGTSTPSSTASSTAATVPVAPSGLSGTASSTSIILGWTDNATNELVYSIERGFSTSTLAHIATTTANSISYTDSGLLSGTLYYHRVRAWNGVGYSGYSNTASTTTGGLNAGLIHYWKLDESSGDAADAVGSTTMTNVNSTVFATGKINNGLDIEFDNLNTLSSTSNLQGSPFTQYSSCAWLKPESTPAVNDSYVIFTSYDTPGTWDMRYINVDGTPNIKLNHFIDGDVIAALYPVTLPTDGWTQYCASWNGSEIQMYLNGGAVGSAVSVSSIRINTETSGTYIGSQSGSQQWDGLIDEVGVWNRALSSGEIGLLYNSGAGNQYPF